MDAVFHDVNISHAKAVCIAYNVLAAANITLTWERALYSSYFLQNALKLTFRI